MNHDQMVIFLIVFCSIAFAVIAMQTYFDVRRNQQKKEAEQQAQQRSNQVFVRKMRVLEQIIEKTTGQISTPTFLLESEGGERITLRLPLGSRIHLTVGEVGMVEYKGEFIQAFTRIGVEKETP